ncbi:GNAT family N-acetyltransferase [Clostridium sp. LBM24168]
MEWEYEDGRIYSLGENNELMAETTFLTKKNGEVDINHTYINPVLRGQGMAGKMMNVVSQFLRKNELRAVATCPYANDWLKKHKNSYRDIISEKFK